jgi:hypothetical protein
MKNFFNFPDNPNSHLPERKDSVRYRFMTFMGGVAIAGSSKIIAEVSNFSDLTRDYLNLPIMMGIVVSAIPVTAELIERFIVDKGIDPGEDNGGWGDYDPPPIKPDDPGGLQIDWDKALLDLIEQEKLTTF